MEEIKKQNSDEMKEIKLEGNAADLADAIQTIDIEEDSIEIEEVSLNEEPEEADDIAEEKVSRKQKKGKRKIAKFWKIRSWHPVIWRFRFCTYQTGKSIRSTVLSPGFLLTKS